MDTNGQKKRRAGREAGAKMSHVGIEKTAARKSIVDEDSEDGHRMRRFLMENRTMISGRPRRSY